MRLLPFIFLTCIGQKGREIYETFTFEPGDEMKLAPVLHKFLKYCNPRKNILRHKFFTYRKQEGQNFHDFVTELKKWSSKCEFEGNRRHIVEAEVLLRCAIYWHFGFFKEFQFSFTAQGHWYNSACLTDRWYEAVILTFCQ